MKKTLCTLYFTWCNKRLSLKFGVIYKNELIFNSYIPNLNSTDRVRT